MTVKLPQAQQKEKLFETINNCRICNGRYGKEPFHFPIKDQKIMLISATPSIQAMHRPLTSIRFFRHICVALFGEKGISTEAIDAMHNLIYWTHMHKCCYYEARKIDDFSALPKVCRDNHLAEEIKVIRPMIIIGLGIPVAQTLFQEELKEKKIKQRGYFDDCHYSDLKNECIALKKGTADVYLTDFPSNGREKRFDMIKKRLSTIEGFEFMRPETAANWFPNEIDYSRKNLRGLNVNIDFEVKAMEHNLHPGFSKKNCNQVTANDLWLQNIVSGNLINYDKATRIIFYLEDIIRTLMTDILSDNAYWRTINDLRNMEFNSRIPLTYENIHRYLEHGWDRAFRDHFIYRAKNERKEGFFSEKDIQVMCNKIRYLKFIRNKIVHNSGYIEPSRLNKHPDYFPGIKHYVNFILLSKEGLSEIKEFADQTIAFIKKIDLKRVK